MHYWICLKNNSFLQDQITKIKIITFTNVDENFYKVKLSIMELGF